MKILFKLNWVNYLIWLIKDIIQEYLKKKDLLKTFSNSILKNIISSLYYPVSPYDFTVIISNILGEIYKLFLTGTLVEENGTIKLQVKKDNINRSIVATPYDIVKYMTEKALGKMLERRHNRGKRN